MPAMQAVHDDSGAFTVINHEGKARERLVAADPPLARNVNVVKPLRRADDQREHFNSACTRPQPPAPEPPAAAPQPRTILDPKFSRALDFKLRRLKEKEILKENLRRPTRYKPRNGLAASSIPNISCKERVAADSLSRSHPRIDAIPLLDDSTPKMDTTPSPGRRARGLVAARSMIDNDKPRFVTTVKSGQFLLPPPEVATLLGLETLYPPQEREKIVYSYASKPKALASRAKRSPPEPKKEVIPNGVVSTGAGAGAGSVRRAHVSGVGSALSGVRALVAGVVGLRHLHPAHGTDSQARASGSVATSGPYSNVMHERRVVRGATFATHPPHAAAGDGGESAAARAARTRRRAAARRAAARLRPGTPPPAPGRRHHPIQTEYYLEELFDKGVEMEVGVQTDLFVDRPATPVYVPAKTGADAATQIYPGDLFDFDLEVQPILEVLVGKTTEQALAEVAQEEELATLREQQRRYCELRDAERAERQRLAAQHTRLHNEKERRVSEARAAALAAEEARSRAAAAALVQGYVAELLPSALAGLRDQGYLVERIERGVDEEFMPWLVQEVSREIESIITSRDVITEIVREVVEGRSELYRAAGEREAAASPPLESITPPSVPDGEGQAGTLFGPHSIYHQMPVRSLYRATMNTNMSPRKDLEE